MVLVDRCRVVLKLDEGLDAILLPYFEFRKKFPKAMLKPSNAMLEGPDKSTLDVAGYFIGELKNKVLMLTYVINNEFFSGDTLMKYFRIL